MAVRSGFFGNLVVVAQELEQTNPVVSGTNVSQTASDEVSVSLTRFRSVKLPSLALVCCELFVCLSVQRQMVGQTGSTAPGDASTISAASNPPQQEARRLFGVVPNYRTSPTLHPYVPISPKEKFKIASEDAFDRGTV